MSKIQCLGCNGYGLIHTCNGTGEVDHIVDANKMVCGHDQADVVSSDEGTSCCGECAKVFNQPSEKLQSDEMPERCQYKRIQDKGEYELFDTCHVPIELAYSAIDEFEFCPYCGKRIEVKEADHDRD